MSVAGPAAEGEGRWKFVCAYDGTDFDGWQSQASGNAVQDRLEAVFQRLTGRPMGIVGCSRTDAGVHARGQCFHADLDWRHEGRKLVDALRAQLPPTIAIVSAERVGSGFHARYNATGKTYSYRFRQGRADPFESRFVVGWREGVLDPARMRAVLPVMTGERDFRALAAQVAGRDDTVRRIDRLVLHEPQPGVYRLEVSGPGFLYKMVRGMAGAMLAAGVGRLTPERLDAILRAGERHQVIATAPAHGLCLEEIRYPDPSAGGVPS